MYKDTMGPRERMPLACSTKKAAVQNHIQSMKEQLSAVLHSEQYNFIQEDDSGGRKQAIEGRPPGRKNQKAESGGRKQAIEGRTQDT